MPRYVLVEDNGERRIPCADAEGVFTGPVGEPLRLRRCTLPAELSERLAAVVGRAPTGGEPLGRAYRVDGAHVSDITSYCCALGEAVNGPGGYFGWNLDALADCLRGGFGAAPPFTVVGPEGPHVRKVFERAGVTLRATP